MMNFYDQTKSGDDDEIPDASPIADQPSETSGGTQRQNFSELRTITIAGIQLDAGTQTRSWINWVVVDEYAEAMSAGAKFPPPVVFYDGKNYFAADGFHRILAAIETGRTEIEADVRYGTLLDGLTYSLGANATHGQPRSNDDKRCAVRIAILRPEFANLSSHAIAEICAVSHTLVDKVRAELATDANSPRIGRDNKVYPIKKRESRKTDIPNAGDSANEKVEVEHSASGQTDNSTGKAEIITRITRAVARPLPDLDETALLEFEADLQQFISDWLAKKVIENNNPQTAT